MQFRLQERNLLHAYPSRLAPIATGSKYSTVGVGCQKGGRVIRPSRPRVSLSVPSGLGVGWPFRYGGGGSLTAYPETVTVQFTCALSRPCPQTPIRPCMLVVYANTGSLAVL